MKVAFQWLRTPIFLLASCSAVLAQSNYGAIDGIVVDTARAVVANAPVEVVNRQTGQTRALTSSSNGYFNFPDLQPGNYTVRINVPGFKTVVLEPLVLTVGQHMTLRPVLEVGSVSESVEVSGTPPPVTTANSSLSQVVDTQRISELPLNGRNALQLVSLVPGVVSTGTGGQFGATQQTFSASGGRNIDMNFTLDGAFNMNSFYGIANEYPNPDALQEFAVSSRSYSAAFGRGTTSVSAVTKSGSNEIHGSLFEFLRNTDLDARPFFASHRPVFKRNQFGGTIGGPIVKNKLFFFLGYQGTKVRGNPSDQTYTTLTDAERRGDFSASAKKPVDPVTKERFPGDVIPPEMLNPAALNFLQNYLPRANSGTNIYRFTSISKLDQNQGIARVDYSISDKDRLSFRYFINDVPQTSGSSIDQDWISELPTRFQNSTLTYTRIFTPNIINDFRFSYIRNAFGVIPQKDFSLTGLGYPVSVGSSFSDFGLMPSSSLDLSGFFSAALSSPTRDVMPTTHIADTLSWIHGSHKLDFGFEYYRNRVNELQNWLTGGSMSFNGTATNNAAADFLIGKFNSFRQVSGLSSRLRQNLPALFVQEEWKATSRLTLSAGLRWEPYFGYISQDQQLSVFQSGSQSTLFPKAVNGLLYHGDSGVPDSIVGARWNNLAPRAGFAWDVTGKGTTSVRGGFGVYFAPLTRGISLNRFTLIQPFVLDVSVFGGDASNIFAAPPFNGVNPFPRPMAGDLSALQQLDFVPGANATSFGLPFKTQTDYQWSFSIQHALSQNDVVEINYVGSSSSHLFTSVEGNPATYIPGASTTSNTQSRRPYQQLGALNVGISALSANYNSLQLHYNHRFSHGVSFQSSYTWSKALGVVGSFGEGSNGPRNPYDYRSDYGPQSFDIPHNFVTSFIWAPAIARNSSSRLWKTIADGWQFTGIFTVRSGTPLTLRSGLDNSRTAINNDTPDVVGDWRVTGDRSKADQINQWFNQAAFTQNAIGTFGQLGIGALRNPGLWNWDCAASKNFNFSEQRKLEFRSSFYNVFNHANLGAPNGTLTSPNFGRITTTTDPRVIEFGLRLVF